jgi:exonuclease SbcD
VRALCVGDLHLGAGAEYGRDPGSRLADQEAVWEAILGVAVDQNVDAVLFAGDAFHRRRPTPAELVAFQRPLQRFNAEHDIDVLAFNGNHDVESGDLPSALELFSRELDLHTEPGIWTPSGTLFTPGEVAVCTLPWTPVSRLIASRGGGDRDDNHQLAAQILIEIAREQRAQISGPAVLMLHWSVSGASTPTGVLTDEFRETVIPLADLESLGFDAIVCGHIHKPQLLDGPTLGFYTGSPMPVDFGEASVEHGVALLDVDGARTLYTFVPIESRPFVTLDLDGAQMQTLPDTEWQDVTDAVVRVRYRATEEQARRVDHAAIARALMDAGAWKVFAIQPTILRENRARIEGATEDLAPLAALGLWMDANEITEREPLAELTARYLEDVAA